MSGVKIPINVKTCKLNGFWQQEIISKQVKPQMECCSLLANAPSEIPLFCPPTLKWCDYQQKSGPVWTKVKDSCCSTFGAGLKSVCEVTQPATKIQAAAPPAKVDNKPVRESISQTLGLKINAFNLALVKDDIYGGLHADGLQG